MQRTTVAASKGSKTRAAINGIPASNATEHQIQGLGLGLAICRQLVELHGGRICATSPGEGHGTTVALRLPTPDVVNLPLEPRPADD